MASVLVTGAGGFVGTHLVPTLRAAGHEVISLNSDAGDVAEEATWAKLPKVDVVVHLAAKTFVPDSWQDPSAFFRTNLLGTTGALNYCRTHEAHLVFLSSYLYGHPEMLPVAETARVSVTNPYALSKKLAEDACEFYSRAFGVNVTVFRPFNIYGPGQPEHFLIPLIVRQLDEGKGVRVLDLEPKRDYVYVSDLADAIASSIVRPARYRVLNIGTGESYSVNEVVQALQRLKGTDVPVSSANERRPNEILDCQADIRAARRELDWQPRVSLEEGLRRVVHGGSPLPEVARA